MPKAFQPYMPPKFPDPFKMPKEPKPELPPHIMTEYERQLIETLCPAINNKQLIKFWYDDKEIDFADWRLVEPHLIGQTNYKHENIWLVGWFLPTPEQLLNGHEAKWGNYILDNVTKVEILDRQYCFTRPGYNKNDKRMKTIYCATD